MATIIATELAASIGKTIFNGGGVRWLPSDLLAIDVALRPLTSQRPTDEDGQYIFDGNVPGWLAVAVVHSLNRQGVALREDPQLPAVTIPKLTPAGSGSKHLTWKVNQDAGGLNLVQFSLPADNIQPSSLRGIVPPAIHGDRGVLLKGESPNWLLASLALGYHDTPWLATFRPASLLHPAEYVVCMTHTRDVPLGTTMLETDVQSTWVNDN